MERMVEERSWVKAWPMNRPALLRAGIGALILLAIWSVAGRLYLSFLDDGPVGDADRRVNTWLEEHRTDTWNTLTHYGSMLSDTITKVVLIAVVGGVMIAVWRRWHDAVLLASVVIVESSVFAITSFIVDRERPPVEQLDAIPPSGSFPSGHTAASVAFYGGVFLIVCWHTRRRAVRAVFLAIAVIVPLIVASSRVYRGMHHPIDVLAGMALGAASLVVMNLALHAGVAELDRRSRDGKRYPPQTLSLETWRPAPRDHGDIGQREIDQGEIDHGGERTDGDGVVAEPVPALAERTAS